jgi:carbon monoxide dehydrogenase subunit G
MDMSGEKSIAATKETIWSALHDPKILQACIPGCESVEFLSDTEFQAVSAIEMGPIAARFTGKFLLSEIDPPNGYTISGEGQGGIAGSATGEARVKLTEAEGGTTLAYQVNAEIWGKLSQLAPQLIDSTAHQVADEFLRKFASLVAPHAPAPKPAFNPESPYHNLAEDHDHDPSNPHYFGLPIGVIIAAAIATISVGLTILKYVK